MEERIKNYDYLRSISCIAVVLLHVSSSYWSVVNIQSTDFAIMTVYNALTRFAVPTFMMLSGLFLLSPQKEMSYKNIAKRILKLLVIFYIWSAFYAFQGIAVKLITGKGITGELMNASLERFLWGHYHMWFVFLILGFYILLPIARKLCESKAVIEYYLLLWISIAYIIPAITQWIGMNWINVWINKLNMNMLIGYLGYFLLGYYIKAYGINQKVHIILYFGGVIGLFYTAIETIRQSRTQGIYVDALFSPSSWNVLLMTIAIFVFFTYRKEMIFGYPFVSKLAKYSFTIYMIHPFFLEKLNMIGITTCSFYSLLSVPLLTIIILSGSFLVSYIIEKVCPKLLL